MFHLKRYYILCIAFFACILLSAHAFAQPQARGFGNAAPAAASTSAGRTVALVVGVSDYPYVAPLNYAAEDALLMNDFLQSKAGGSVEPANIRLLLNEEATLQNVVIRGISWLENTIKPTKGDLVIIYLAGHGDAVDASEAYFLCYNVNPAGDKNNYQVTGALDIGKLKSRISKFSSAGAEVVLIMDACRSGDLPGVRTGITNPFESVIERKAGETLMLSASANQLAVEDGRWGRGHGVFTWNLIQGLSGKADENGDGSVDFYEIEQYTKAKVRKETQVMGRMQVPQFAASPSGGGLLGRTDNVFLNKLSTEALSAVSVSESITQARTAAESSWFTDSILYEGFNEIKKLVRQNKYLGDGSAEPIYIGLAEKFSADQIEPVRLYYMSALASAGFEAINKELTLNIGVTLTTKFYERRWAYLNKAYQLQRKPDEVHQLENYRKLVEAIYLRKRDAMDREKYTPFTQGLVDSIADMRNQFGNSAAYFYWMAALSIDPWKSIEIAEYYSPNPLLYSIHSRTNRINLDSSLVQRTAVFHQLIDSCFRLAPDWPKVLIARLDNMTIEDCDVAIGDKILKLIESDSTNADYWYTLSKYYTKHKPYNLAGWYRSLLKSCLLEPNALSTTDLLNVHVSGLSDVWSMKCQDGWLRSQALKHRYNFAFDDSDFDAVFEVVKAILIRQTDDEIRMLIPDYFIEGFIEYCIQHDKLSDFVHFISTDKTFNVNQIKHQRLHYLSVLSSYSEKIGASEVLIAELSDDLAKCINNEPNFFSDSIANFIAHRLYNLYDVRGLEEICASQLSQLERFQYDAFPNELTLFLARCCEEYKGLFPAESIADKLLKVCYVQQIPKNLKLYYYLLNSNGFYERIERFFEDPLFKNFADSIQLACNDSVLTGIECGYVCAKHDSIALRAMFAKGITDLNHYEIDGLLKYVPLDCRKYLQIDLIVMDTTVCSFNSAVVLLSPERALKFYDVLKSRGERIMHGITLSDYCDFEFAEMACRMFNMLGDYAHSAVCFEQLMDRGQMGYSTSQNIQWDGTFGPYDAFIQSKEYKAMMARVYAAPEK